MPKNFSRGDGACFSTSWIWDARVTCFEQQNAIQAMLCDSGGWAFRGLRASASSLMEVALGAPGEEAGWAHGCLQGLGQTTEAPWPAACTNSRRTGRQSEAVSDLVAHPAGPPAKCNHVTEPGQLSRRPRQPTHRIVKIRKPWFEVLLHSKGWLGKKWLVRVLPLGPRKMTGTQHCDGSWVD